MKKVIRSQSKEAAITLVALVVTIVVLLILVGVMIRYVIGQDGLIKKEKKQEIYLNKLKQMKVYN